MNIGQRMVSGLVSALCLGFLVAALPPPAEAGGRSVQLVHGKRFPPGSAQLGVPQDGRPLYSPPVFVDRSAPISERPLAPIGDGVQVAPGSAPFVWCQGEWIRIDNFRPSCPSR